MKSQTLTAIAILVGTTIGAGILGLPYVVMRSGFLIGIINILLAATLILILNLYLGEVTLRTKSTHQLPGYAEKYLGKKGKNLMALSLFIGIFSALVAYLIGEGKSLSFLFTGTFDYSLHFGIAFWFFMAFITHYGLKSLKQGEKIGVATVIILITLITVFFSSKIRIENLSYINASQFYVPFGVAIFAFLGFSSIPLAKKILNKELYNFKKIILISLCTVLIIYLIFTTTVLGSLGEKTPEISSIGLGVVFVVLGMFTMGTSYLALTNNLTDALHEDLKKDKLTSWFLTIIVPLAIFIILTIAKIDSFVKVLGVGGVISGGIAAVLILFMVKKAKSSGDRKPEYSIPYFKVLSWTIIIVLSAGTILEIINSIS